MTHPLVLLMLTSCVWACSSTPATPVQSDLCAHIKEGPCECKEDCISSIIVVNDLKDHGVMVTVHQHLWTTNRGWVDGERVVDVLAGRELFFDCRPVIGDSNTYTVVGCEVR